MLNFVCASASSSARSTLSRARVIDPPSNIRETPNGNVVCQMKDNAIINVEISGGNWDQTDACGSPGWIHQSQIRVVD